MPDPAASTTDRLAFHGIRHAAYRGSLHKRALYRDATFLCLADVFAAIELVDFLDAASLAGEV